MGHKEDLLEGAKKCLVEKGFVRTTARDIVGASGTNLASIGYHYGSKDALLTQAFVALTEEWGANAFQGVLPGADGSLERLGAMWNGVLAQHEESAPVWAASMEVVLSGERLAQLRGMLAASQGEGRRGLISLLTGTPEEELTERDERTLGSVMQALLNGLMVQWLLDPASASSAEEFTEGLRRLAEALTASLRGGSAGEAAP
ncbi:TetR/AcrR family transcriptional regulator [Streptomyces sp. NPDC090077]|uniref:TetR/AcrR family transcriptional regulator n=1 Tax=Streptomyces sp. NPDC090077 TaxID=3365938 RepID=UPI0038223A5C